MGPKPEDISLFDPLGIDFFEALFILIPPTLYSLSLHSNFTTNRTTKIWTSDALYGQKLYIPFFTSGSLLLLSAVMLTAMFIFLKYVPKSHANKEEIPRIEKEYERRYSIRLTKSPMTRKRSTTYDNIDKVQMGKSRKLEIVGNYQVGLTPL